MSQVVFPVPARPWQARLDRVATSLTRTRLHCNVCGHWTSTEADQDNYRESLHCGRCGAFNRQRQMAHVILAEMSKPRPLGSLADLVRDTTVSIYNTEARGAVHDTLRSVPGYIASEFFGPSAPRGSDIDGVRNEDLQQLSFADSSFDLVLSCDVFEHIPEPYVAHREIHRVLRSGGRHIFTVPFNPGSGRDDIRAVPGPDGHPVLLAEPQYHGDPQNPETGALVYTIFGMGMLTRLEEVGFVARMHRVHSRLHGIYGDNGFVFVAVKP